MSEKNLIPSQADMTAMPDRYPTHLHEPQFWEALGRAVATFGFLEETLVRAIFAITATKEYATEEELAEALEGWGTKLERALADQLNGLIQTFAKEVRAHGEAEFEGFDDLIAELHKARELRNVLCHGSWRPPHPDGSSRPFYVKKGGQVCDDHMDLDYLTHVQKGTMELAAHVMTTVTALGWQFPGSDGPGRPVIELPKVAPKT